MISVSDGSVVLGMSDRMVVFLEGKQWQRELFKRLSLTQEV